MPYTSLISRSSSNPPAMVSDGASALIPEDVSHEIMHAAIQKSVALQMFQHRTMSRKQQRIPVLSLKPSAYFVNGDTGLKQTTAVNWANKYLNAEEIAVIVPIPENLLDDVDYDLWAEIKPELSEAIAVCLDEAIFFGVNAPSSWPTSIAAAALAAGNVVTRGASAIDMGDDLNNVLKAIEKEGYNPNGWIIRPQLRADLRGLRATTRELIFLPNDPGIENTPTSVGTVWGLKAYTNMEGFAAFGSTGGAGFYEAIAGDFSQGIIGVRKDITFKMLDQAVLQDLTGAITYNLAQQDMVAMRVTCRFGFQVPNPPTRLAPTEANRYPFGLLRQT